MMLIWALRYLAMALVVGAAFAVLQEGWIRESWQAAHHRPTAGPAHAGSRSMNEHTVVAGRDGHFMLDAVANGERVAFLIDTGATDVMISLEDAARLGFQVERLRFTRRYLSANGEIRAAPVSLRELRLGQHSMFDVDAAVADAPLPVSVLGMSFLNQLGGYRVEGERLYLYW